MRVFTVLNLRYIFVIGCMIGVCLVEVFIAYSTYIYFYKKSLQHAFFVSVSLFPNAYKINCSINISIFGGLIDILYISIHVFLNFVLKFARYIAQFNIIPDIKV